MRRVKLFVGNEQKPEQETEKNKDGKDGYINEVSDFEK